MLEFNGKSLSDLLLLRSLDYSRLMRLVRALISDTAGCAVGTLDKKVVWSSHPELLQLFGTLCEDSHFLFRPIDSAGLYFCADSEILEIPLVGSYDEPFGLLYLQHKPAPGDKGIASREVVRLITEATEQEFSHLRQIATMTKELSSRYDELNLMFDTEETANRRLDWKSSVSALMGDFRNMLDFGFAALLMSDSGFSPSVRNWSRCASEETAILKTLRAETLPWIEFNNIYTIVNHPDDPMADACESLPFKMVACPIHDQSKNPIGALVVLNAYHDRDFTSSDHNLCEIMAKRIAKSIGSQHDPLTGLLNRGGFEYILHDAFQASVLQGDEHCLINLDLDRLSLVNEMAGYEAGDRVIQFVSQQIKREIRHDDVAARIGGDVFLCLLNRCGLQEGEEIARRIMQGIASQPFVYEDIHLEISASIGLTSITRDAESSQSVLAAAEIAHEAAKEAGTGRLRVFAQGNVNLIRREQEIQWVNRIQSALREDRFELFAQSMRAARPGHPHHFEILLRLKDQNGKICSPAEFMPTAERYQMMVMIDRWVVENTIRQIVEFRNSKLIAETIWAINISTQSLIDDHFQRFFEEQIMTPGLNPACICIEIKETTALENVRQARHFMESLKGRGVKFSLDDFGSGLASFTFLQTLGVQYLKIYGQHVRKIVKDPVCDIIVQSVCNVGKQLGIICVAEFVEDEAIERRLLEMGIDFLQGFGIAYPAPLQGVLGHLSREAVEHA